jgi:hypothetical protein
MSLFYCWYLRYFKKNVFVGAFVEQNNARIW